MYIVFVALLILSQSTNLLAPTPQDIFDLVESFLYGIGINDQQNIQPWLNNLTQIYYYLN